MAGEGYRALAQAKQKQRKIEWEKNVGMEGISAFGELTAFAGGQAKQTETAWDEYETGYEALGGDPADIEKRGGFFKQLGQTLIPGGDKGFFQRPEGEVKISGKMYDRSKIQKAGSFLGSDAASTLNQTIRDEYLGRTAPGKEIPKTFTSHLKFDQTGGVGVNAGFGTGTGGIQKDFLKDYKMTSIDVGERGRYATETVAIQESQLKDIRKSQAVSFGVQHELTGKDFQPSVAVGERERDAAGTVAIQAHQQEQLNLMSQGRAPGLFRQTREGGAPVQDNSLDAILESQSVSATEADKRSSVIDYGGSGTGIDPNIQGTGNEFIDRQLGGYTESPLTAYEKYMKRLQEGDVIKQETGFYKR